MLKSISRSIIVALGLTASLVGMAPKANAAFHLWQINELFTNQCGSVKFIQLFTPFDTQQFTNTFTIKSNTKTFTFPSDTSSPTGNHHILLATSGFGALSGGATPDFIIPSNFFSTAGDTINVIPEFNGGVDIRTFASIPTDGVNSLNYAGMAVNSPGSTTAANSPRNYAGAGGTLNLAAPSPTGDYNGNHTVDAADYVLWRDTLNATVTNGSGADGSNDGTINPADLTFWRSKFGNAAPGSGSAVPEPSSFIALGLFAFIFSKIRHRR